jgi:hypothetical protein
MRTNPTPWAITAALALAVSAAACGASSDEQIYEVSMDSMVERVLQPRCTFGACHAAPTRAADLDLTAPNACEQLVNKPSCLFPNQLRIAPGLPDESFFLHKLTGDGLHVTPTAGCSGETNALMPYGASKLPEAEIALVRNWILAGAPCEVQQKPGPEGPKPGPLAIAQLAASPAAPAAGQLVALTITLTEPAPAGGAHVQIESMSTALSAPLQVVVPAGSKTARVDAYAERPAARFVVAARVGASARELVMRIGGLEIAEVFVDAVGPDDGLQWVKLRNTTALPIELAGYRVRAGQASFAQAGLALTGKLAPGACAVVGGPLSTAANGAPAYFLAADFAPDLPRHAAATAGYAVFEDAAVPVSGMATPVDALLIGTGNAAQLRGADGEIAEPGCASVPAGSSARRGAGGICAAAAPRPSQCP